MKFNIWNMIIVLNHLETIYLDPNYIRGYYFLGNISKESIKVIDREK